MSTFIETLYRPIKIEDMTNLGFELINDNDRIYFSIKASDIKEYVIKDKLMISKLLGEDTSFDPNQYYYLHPGEIFDRKSKESTWYITKYGGNTPALQYLVNNLAKLGYKMKCDGVRLQ
jgi:hypothetical protein